MSEDLENWEAFEERIRNLRIEQERPYNPLLFRGQASAGWQLQTTLERTPYAPMKMADYYHLVIRIKPEIQAFAEARWLAPTFEAASTFSANYDSLRRGSSIPAFSYLAYLRHHGFPSPLLDWTLSPYVAAFFAFAEPKEARVAIYVFSEWPEGMKSASNQRPSIHSFGNPPQGHKRHFSQQSRYTMAVKHDLNRGWSFVPHESVGKSQFQSPVKQDQIHRFTLPASERQKVLRRLNDFNLHAFSLFGTPEALMQTIAQRELLKLEGARSTDPQ